MNLPQLQTPVYKTKLISNNKEILFRPFLVKEEKILLTSMETKETDTIIENYIQILKNCILSENTDIEKLPSFDCILLFIELRKKSIGEIIDISIKDPEINKYFDVEMDLNNIKIINKRKKNNNKIQLTEDIGIVLKYPTIKEALSLGLEKNINNNFEKISDILISCIDKIYDSDKIYEIENYTKEEIIKFIDQLTPSMVSDISSFFSNMPKIIYENTYPSPFSQKKIQVRVENFIDFLI